MQRFEDRSFMQAPGLCFVCETAPQAGVIDTGQNFTPGFPSNLDGRKYVCDGCVKSLSEAAGHYATEDVEAATNRADEADARYNAVRSFVAEVAAQLTDVELVSAGDRTSYVVANTPAPKTRTKKVVDEPSA